jgi:hypothetical protein
MYLEYKARGKWNGRRKVVLLGGTILERPTRIKKT